MKKVLVIGSGGMAGHMVTTYFESLKKYHVINSSFPQKFKNDSIVLDIMDRERTERLIRQEKPDIVINCIGILISLSNKRPDIAAYINSYFPHQLEQLGKETGSKIIHLSTDCVFSGKKGGYTENDPKDGTDFYAQSKALGEIVNAKDLTFRTSIIGPELNEKGEGLFHWFMKQKSGIQGYSRVYWTGITTLELAEAMDKAIEQDLTGLYHIVAPEKISKLDLLKLLKKIWKRDDISITEFTGAVHDKSLINTRSDFNFKVRGYEEMLGKMYEWMKEHRQIYSLYDIK